ncbi:MAG: hypothetical protein PHE02_08885, partial [Lachnospiraceae bacterium]|nr:hypothetical protein [Lachnospiraceae bacterium]
MKILTVMGYMGVLILLVYLILQSKISIGVFAAIYASIWKMYNLMNELIGRHIGNIFQNMSSIKNFISFMDIAEYTPTLVQPSKGYAVELNN